MNVLQLVASVLLICFGTFVAVMNWRIAIGWFLWRERSSSVPLFGGLTAAYGISLFPYYEVGNYWWIPLFVDWGCIPGFVFTFAWLAYRGTRRR